MRIINCIFFLALGFSTPYFADDIQIPIDLIHATNEHSRNWGLMGRETMPENQGLLLQYSSPRFVSIWMYNVKFDLSVAFLDEKGVILETRELKSYPEKMKDLNAKPVNSVKDLENLNILDPAVSFFLQKTISSSNLAQYALEMHGGWFAKNHILPGDRLVWENGQSSAVIIHHQN